MKQVHIIIGEEKIKLEVIKERGELTTYTYATNKNENGRFKLKEETFILLSKHMKEALPF